MTGCHTPIAYIVFNRPQHTEKTFAVIREQRPSKLLIIADGPRRGHATDEQRCQEVRSIVDNVDWPCDVHRNYADSNLGLKRRVSSGLDWVFQRVDRAIVLEDDCLAHPDFFRFCEILLDRYAEDSAVWVITGQNLQGDVLRGHGAYYFSKYSHCWGWATWKRAWSKYDGNLSFLKSDDATEMALMLSDKAERGHWQRMFERVRAGELDSWSYPWQACVWFWGGLTATPNSNLVSNIGFGEGSTHTTNPESDLANMSTQPVGDLDILPAVKQNKEADRFVFDFIYGGRNLRFPRNLAYTIFKKIQNLTRKRI